MSYILSVLELPFFNVRTSSQNGLMPFSLQGPLEHYLLPTLNFMYVSSWVANNLSPGLVRIKASMGTIVSLPRITINVMIFYFIKFDNSNFR